MNRILEFADGPCRLHVRNAQLVIDREGEPEVTTPVEELAVLVLTHPRVQVTQAVIHGMAAHGGSVVFSDERHLPAAMMLPMNGHFIQTERFAKQAQMKTPLRKRLWQQIVKAKVRNQGRLLRELHGSDSGLAAMADRVRSGDPENLEAQAARRYWPLLFGDPKFRRGREGPDQNSHLNYGYTVLRAVVARAICAAGLHPSFGLQHHNRYDTFCLASDLMEPFRPGIVDRAVALWVQEHDPGAPLDREAKQWLLQPLSQRYAMEEEARTLFDLMARTASGLARILEEGGGMLEIPEV